MVKNTIFNKKEAFLKSLRNKLQEVKYLGIYKEECIIESFQDRKIKVNSQRYSGY